MTQKPKFPLPPPEVIAKAIEIIRQKELKQKNFIEQFGHIRPPTAMKAFGDKVVSLLENGIYIQNSEQTYNFVNVLHDHALLFLGEDFLQTEENKDESVRHIAVQWMLAWANSRNEQLGRGISQEEIKEVGVSAAWFRFASDLYTIRDNAKLEARLKSRLLKPATFQGARHELRVAAIFIAADFTIKFEDDSDNSRRHGEFIATDNFSGQQIMVEAKSRHRLGVLGFTSGREEERGQSVNIKNCIQDGYKKKTDLPLYIFVEANLPPVSAKYNLEYWLEEIDSTMHELADKGFANPCPANVVFFCNDPSHYIMDRPLNDDTDFLWISFHAATSCRVTHTADDIIARLKKAFHQRVSFPEAIDFS